MHRAVLLFLLVLANSYICNGSLGDQSPDYRACLDRCVGRECTTDEKQLPLELRIFGWTCIDNCKYECMQRVTKEHVRAGIPVRQFHGKWPFIRLGGIQEPASVLASLLNAMAHYVGMRRFTRLIPKAYRLTSTWRLWGFVSFNAWFWSAVFHTRDLPFTEMMDYFSATATILMQTYAAILHTGGSVAWNLRHVVAILLLGFYAYHVNYLARRHRFDYGYNMAVNVVIAIAHSLAWLIWCFLNRKRKPYVWKGAVSILACGGLMLLELFDFPPIFWAFDAHCLWHFGTAPVTLLMYDFIIEDCLHDIRHPHKSGKVEEGLVDKPKDQ